MLSIAFLKNGFFFKKSLRFSKTAPSAANFGRFTPKILPQIPKSMGDRLTSKGQGRIYRGCRGVPPPWENSLLLGTPMGLRHPPLKIFLARTRKKRNRCNFHILAPNFLKRRLRRHYRTVSHIQTL